MESVLPLAGFGFALGWPLEWVIQRFPRGTGTAPSSRRRWIVAAITAALFALEAVSIGIVPELLPALLLTALVVPAAAIDLEHRIIPDLINLPGAVAVYVVSVAPGMALQFSPFASQRCQLRATVGAPAQVESWPDSVEPSAASPKTSGLVFAQGPRELSTIE